MLVTSIIVKRFANSETRLKGIASVVLDNMLVLHDIKILENTGECLFLAMPSRSTRHGDFKDIFHPINSNVRETLERLIFSTYHIVEKECNYSMEMVLCERLYEEMDKNFFDLTIDDFTIGKTEETLVV